ncbi:hypothetical protein GCM10027517_08930 [Phycicoccus ginsengisoli]
MQQPAVVVGTDGSWESHAAVRAATRLAALHGEPLVVLAVSLPVDARLLDHRSAQDAARSRGVATATRAVELAHETDAMVPVEVVVLTDLEDPVLRSVGARASRLVVGGHGAGGQSAFSLGTVSEALTRLIPRPVLVTAGSRSPRSLRASAGGTPAPRVLVGYRPSVDPPHQLTLAAEEAAVRGVVLRVLTSVPGRGDVAEVQHAVWDAIRTDSACAEVACEVEVVREPPEELLHGEPRECDLLVVGTRGGGTLAGLVRGSVARSVLDDPPCDVLVVPPSVAAAPRTTHASAG